MTLALTQNAFTHLPRWGGARPLLPHTTGQHRGSGAGSHHMELLLAYPAVESKANFRHRSPGSGLVSLGDGI